MAAVFEHEPIPVGGDADRVGAIRALEDLKAQASAVQARLTAELTASVAPERRRSVASEVALARRESPARGVRMVGLATALTTELPHTLAAMEAGVLSEWRATLIARETACLDPGLRAHVDHRLCAPLPDGTYRFDGWGDRRLVAEAQRIVVAADPVAVVNRRAQAAQDRRVTLRPAPDTMAVLSTLLPAEQGVAVWATLTREADRARAQGDPRSRGQLMADTLVERVTGQSRADAVPVAVNLVISDEALLAGGHEPAWLMDFGQVAADTARDLTRRALDDATASLRRVYAAPATGRLVAMESPARCFPAGLAHFLDLRDRSCRTPYCDAPIRHHDHVHDHAAGGPTTDVNGQGTCEHCNLAKADPDWTSTVVEQTHTVEITTPAGHRYRSRAPAAPTPSRLQALGPPRSRLEARFVEVLLEWAA